MNIQSKFSILIVLLLLSANIKSMKKGVIKKPYTPSFSARHPFMTRTAKSLVGAGGFMVINRAINTTTDITAGLIGFTATYLYNLAFNKPTLIDSLLCDPLRALDEAHTVKKQFEKEQKKVQSADTKSLMTKYEEKCPIFLLDECTKEDGVSCLLSRDNNPSYRRDFENTVSRTFLETKKDPVNYTSFDSKGYFQDCVILTKVLAQKPDAKININLVNLQSDVQYQSRNNQLITWLQGNFSKAQLTLTVHDNFQNYLAGLEGNKFPSSDIITATDIEGNGSYLCKDLRNSSLRELCRKTEEKNPQVSNVVLIKNYRESRGEIKILSFKQESGVEEN